ncbi:hypothetical protein QZH41_015899 [Actinostola sp. cb2023]|nr:hypothetical protein QZH41_015899 [Actinostola sp. cb2023]
MSATQNDSQSSEKEIPPWAKGENLRHVEKDVLIPKIVREISREKCKDYVDDFTNCCKGRTLSMVWTCRKQNRAMKDCLTKYYLDNSIFAEAKVRYLKEREEYQKKYSARGDKKEFKKKEPTSF